MNAYRQRKPGGMITSVYMDVNGQCTRKDKKSEVEVRVMDWYHNRLHILNLLLGRFPLQMCHTGSIDVLSHPYIFS